jgi:hypothetical protein
MMNNNNTDLPMWRCIRREMKKALKSGLIITFCGLDGTRTRDLLRDRQAF